MPLAPSALIDYHARENQNIFFIDRKNKVAKYCSARIHITIGWHFGFKKHFIDVERANGGYKGMIEFKEFRQFYKAVLCAGTHIIEDNREVICKPFGDIRNLTGGWNLEL